MGDEGRCGGGGQDKSPAALAFSFFFGVRRLDAALPFQSRARKLPHYAGLAARPDTPTRQRGRVHGYRRNLPQGTSVQVR